MPKKAARMGDPTVAGGSITGGDATVLIEGMPVARRGDPVADPAFGVGMMSSHANTVWAVSMPIARVDDMAAPSVGAAGAGAPEVIGPGTVSGGADGAGGGDGAPAAPGDGGGASGDGRLEAMAGDDTGRTVDQALAEDGAVGPYASGGATDLNGDGIADGADFETGLVKWDLGEDAQAYSGQPNVGIRNTGSVGKIGVETSGALGPDGIAGNISGEATYAQTSVAVSASDGHGTISKVTGTGKLLTTEGSATFLVGTNEVTGDTGLELGAGWGASVVKGEVVAETTAPLAKAIAGPRISAAADYLFGKDWARNVPFVGDYDLTTTIAGGLDAASVGAGAGIKAVYNSEAKKATFGLKGKLSFLFGGKADIEWALQDVSGAGGGTAPVPGPATVAKGASTVEVGP